MKTTFIIDTCDKRNELVKKLYESQNFICHEFPEKITKLSANVYIFAPNSYLNETHIDYIKPNSYIYTFSLDIVLQKLLEKKDCTIKLLSKNEEFINANAYLTAEGALMHTIANTQKCIKDLNILILGYGHLGKALANTFSNFSSNFTIATQESAEKIDAELKNYNAIDLIDAQLNLNKYDVILNTIPANIFSKTNLKPSVFILELSSKNYPFNYLELTKNNINFLIAKGVPGSTCKISAAKLLANTILKDLNLLEV